MNIPLTLSERFTDLLARHGISIRGSRSMVRCIFHQDGTPSLSVDIERGLFHCFGCGVGGGVKDFALLVGEGWNEAYGQKSLHERRRFAVQTRRRQAEEQARAIVQGRKDDQEQALWTAWFDTNTEANDALELLALFFRRSDLADEFSELAKRTDIQYGEAVSRRAILEAQIAGEMEVGE